MNVRLVGMLAGLSMVRPGCSVLRRIAGRGVTYVREGDTIELGSMPRHAGDRPKRDHLSAQFERFKQVA